MLEIILAAALTPIAADKPIRTCGLPNTCSGKTAVSTVLKRSAETEKPFKICTVPNTCSK